MKQLDLARDGLSSKHLDPDGLCPAVISFSNRSSGIGCFALRTKRDSSSLALAAVSHKGTMGKESHSVVDITSNHIVSSTILRELSSFRIHLSTDTHNYNHTHTYPRINSPNHTISSHDDGVGSMSSLANSPCDSHNKPAGCPKDE